MNQLRPLLKLAARYSLGSRFARPIRSIYRGEGVCLAYHRVCEERYSRCDFKPNACLAVNIEEFEKQMRFASENFRCISLEAAIQDLGSKQPRGDNLVVTFDDGYKDNLELALPILEKYDIPATIFVATGYVDRTVACWWEEQEYIIERASEIRFRWDQTDYFFAMRTSAEKQRAFDEVNSVMRALSCEEQQKFLGVLRSASSVALDHSEIFLSWDEVKQLDCHPLITIGAHTIRHPVLSKLSYLELEHEIHGGKLRLEAELQRPVTHMAYPYGSNAECGEREFTLASRVGFDAAVTTRSGHFRAEHTQHLAALPRMTIDHFHTFDDFTRFRVSGLTQMIHRRGKLLVTD